MARKLLVLMTLTIMMLARSTWAQDEAETVDVGTILVTATKTEERIGHVASSASVVTGDEIEKKKARTVLELLRDIPGLDVVQSGGLGGTTSIYLRGANSGQTLVMIDGVDVKDPTQASGGFFNFAHLTTDNIERIEIVRGPHSTLYGSDAIGGVINIITKKGEGEPRLSGLLEAGAYSTYRESLGVSGGTERITYSLSASRIDSTGFSKAKNGPEDDGYENTSFSGRFGVRIFQDNELELFLRYLDTKTDLDVPPLDDPNYVAKTKSLLLKLEFDQLVTAQWEHKLSLSAYNNDRDFEDALEPGDTWDSSAWYDGTKKNVEWQHNFFLGTIAILTTGFEYEEDQGETNTLSENTADNRGYYVQNQFNFGGELFPTVGIRIDDHELFGSDTNYKLSCAYLREETNTKLKGSWGTGFKAPSVFQLYSSYGDPGLRPEESEGYDMGIEQGLLRGKASIGLTYFHNTFDNLIEYDFATSKYQNIGRAASEGFEFQTSAELRKDLEAGLNYTYTDTEDQATGKDLRRRPCNKYALSLVYQPREGIRTGLSLRHSGSRWNDRANTERLDSYTTVDLTASYLLKPDFEIFGGVVNVFDEGYEEVKGYATPGTSLSLGCKLAF